MAFGPLEEQLVALFRAGAPDLPAAEALLLQGADINASGMDEDESILSEILFAYGATQRIHSESDDSPCSECERVSCSGCVHNQNPEPGRSMCEVIRFFLSHGFDVHKNNGRFGKECLFNLTLSTYDKYMPEAIKILLDAGAQNSIASTGPDDSDDETPMDFIYNEGGSLRCGHHDYAKATYFDAALVIYQAAEDGRPYAGIDSYETAIGKKILRVLAESSDDAPVFFPMDRPGFKKDTCFNCCLYFVYDGGVLNVTQYGDYWTDTVMPDLPMTDVSAYFGGIVGHTVRRFIFDHREIAADSTEYTRPVVTIETDTGRRVTFSTNFGEVAEDDFAAYFELGGQ